MSKFVLIAGLTVLAASAFADKTLYIQQMANGAYSVYDPNKNITVQVWDLKGYLRQNYLKPEVEGFGGRLSNKNFARGTTPAGSAVNAAAETVGMATGAAYSVADRVPSWRRYTAPLRAILGGGSQQAPHP